jgi:hypothetical protein
MSFKQTGWFVIVSNNPKVPGRLAYHCNACSSQTICGNDRPPRAFCCGRWVFPPKETFFGSKMPRVKASNSPRVLHLTHPEL